MAMKMTLDTIRESVKKKFDSAEVEFNGQALRLRNPLVLPEKVRNELMEVINTLGSDGDDELELVGFKEKVRSLIRLVASDRALADSFLAEIAVDGDEEGAEDYELPILLEVFSGYMEDQQVGEASPSES